MPSLDSGEGREEGEGDLEVAGLARPLQRGTPVLVRGIDLDSDLLYQPAHLLVVTVMVTVMLMARIQSSSTSPPPTSQLTCPWLWSWSQCRRRRQCRSRVGLKKWSHGAMAGFLGLGGKPGLATKVLFTWWLCRGRD